MEKQNLTDVIEIEREGEIKIGFLSGGKKGLWVFYRDLASQEDRDLLEALQKAGHKAGDVVKYKIVIERKR